MRIPSGTVDQYLYFVAVDSVNYTTRKTGLTAFTVYRARDAGSATAYTTPTISELSSANMPGVYRLLLDEDMTIGAGNQSEEVAVHITCATMAPVTRTFELYMPTLDEAIMGTNTGKMILRAITAACAGKADGLGTATVHYRNIADTMNVITATVDIDGNRSVVTLDLDDTP